MAGREIPDGQARVDGRADLDTQGFRDLAGVLDIQETSRAQVDSRDFLASQATQGIRARVGLVVSPAFLDTADLVGLVLAARLASVALVESVATVVIQDSRLRLLAPQARVDFQDLVVQGAAPEHRDLVDFRECRDTRAIPVFQAIAGFRAYRVIRGIRDTPASLESEPLFRKTHNQPTIRLS